MTIIEGLPWGAELENRITRGRLHQPLEFSWERHGIYLGNRAKEITHRRVDPEDLDQEIGDS